MELFHIFMGVFAQNDQIIYIARFCNIYHFLYSVHMLLFRIINYYAVRYWWYSLLKGMKLLLQSYQFILICNTLITDFFYNLDKMS